MEGRVAVLIRSCAGKVNGEKVVTMFLIIVHSDEYEPTCATFLYSTDTLETFTMLTCLPNTTLSGPLTMCVHDDCATATTVISTVVIITSDFTTITASTETDSAANPTTSETEAPTTSSTFVSSARDTGGSSSSTVSDASSSQLQTQSPDIGYPSVPSATTHTSSNPPLGVIIGGTLGGLAIAAAVAVALVWLFCVRGKDGRSGKGQTVEPANEQGTISGGVTQLEGDPPKPELSSMSPAIAHSSLTSSPPYQQEPTSQGDSCLESRHELSTGNH